MVSTRSAGSGSVGKAARGRAAKVESKRAAADGRAGKKRQMGDSSKGSTVAGVKRVNQKSKRAQSSSTSPSAMVQEPAHKRSRDSTSVSGACVGGAMQHLIAVDSRFQSVLSKFGEPTLQVALCQYHCQCVCNRS